MAGIRSGPGFHVGRKYRRWDLGRSRRRHIKLAVIGRERHLADPAVSSILTAELPSWRVVVPVTELLFA